MAKRRIAAAATALLGAGLLATIAVPPAPRLVWNASASTPVGLYLVRPGARVEVGDWALVRTPEAVRRLAAERHYLPANVPLVKRVAATGGQRVCTVSALLTVDTRVVAVRRMRDALGRLLPRWQGCRRLRPDEMLVLGIDPGSFDGRYFGPVPRGALLGQAVPLWTW
ncbi:S26 family signal peptidase [Stakelama flava]|uniref:S26 family signal peptidase n=1 Tax=Stakelama flava TaxID=2860338 RepID=UPI0031BB62F2